MCTKARDREPNQIMLFHGGYDSANQSRHKIKTSFLLHFGLHGAASYSPKKLYDYSYTTETSYLTLFCHQFLLSIEHQISNILKRHRQQPTATVALLSNPILKPWLRLIFDCVAFIS